jgi:hypothetical protein
MSKTQELWLSFAAGVALVMAGYTIESAKSYPKLGKDLRETCKIRAWHPECDKEAYRE